MTVLSYKNHHPNISSDVYLAEGVCIIGNVDIGDGASIWFNAVVRGDINFIRIGSRSNIQENSVLHVNHNTQGLVIGNNVTVGHACVLHSCTLEDNSLIGMKSCILDGAIVESGAFVGAGALVPQGIRIPSGSLALGVPAKIVRQLRKEEIEAIVESANHYYEVSRNYMS